MEFIEYLTIYKNIALIHFPPTCNFKMNSESEIWSDIDNNRGFRK